MQDSKREDKGTKRVREESGLDSDSPDSKRVRVDPDTTSPQSVRVDSVINSYESDRVDSDIPEIKEISADILDILEVDDSDTVSDHDPEIQDLDSVIKSFEEEILHPAPEPDSGELGYLLEASDDELGLPPAFSPSQEVPKNKFPDSATPPSDVIELGETLGFEDELPSYYSFGFGIIEENGGNGDFVTLGGLFDYSEASDFPEFSWRPESLPAL